jgi:hypothetical protein
MEGHMSLAIKPLTSYNSPMHSRSPQPIPAEVVYQIWAAHERSKLGDIDDAALAKFTYSELPRRAAHPQAWHRCTLGSGVASELLVAPGSHWLDWSLPEGTYFRVARNILDADEQIPSQTVQRVTELSFSIDRPTTV